MSNNNLTLSEKQRKFSIMVAQFVSWVYTLPGHSVTLGEVFRSPETQQIYINEGKSKTKNSKHLLRLAIDINLFFNGKYITNKESYRILGEKWEEMGGRWGGRFGVKKGDYEKEVGWDAGHFEFK
jgi:hypothetical protein